MTLSTNIVPAVEVALHGQHLIEASAGTGKTWTLTGIVLRLLIEGRRSPEQIIATTFTRAAAAEMRQRIHDRLVDFYQLIQWVEGLSANEDNKLFLYPDILQIVPEDKTDKVTLDNKKEPETELNQDLAYELEQKNEDKAQFKDNAKHDDENKENAIDSAKLNAKKSRDEWLVNEARLARLGTIMQDPINLHLVSYLLDHTTTYSLNEAIKRTALVLTTLDNLFVGTLDSLAQKWLAEYSSETGHQQGMSIIEDASIQQITDSIIHDKLRQFQSKLYHDQPKLYQLMEQKGKLTSVDDHKKYVSRSLNFFSAPIDEIQVENSFDFESYEQLLDKFTSIDLSDIKPYLNPDFRKSQGFNGRSSLFTKFDSILEVHKQIAAHKISFNNYLSEDAEKLLQSLKDARYPDEEGKIKNFNKNKEKQHQDFYRLKTIDCLMAVLDMSEGLDTHILSILANLNRDIVLAVREMLPVILEEQGETTFSLQMVRLNKALTGRQGVKLARYIRHHYPVALIDESQDINGEQAIMIESIYLPSKQVNSNNSDKQQKTKPKNEFLLLVGDPKQAIYGFRGGDVANYNHMKSQFHKNNIWTLNVNRRSNRSLIESLNHWFGMPNTDSVSNDLSQLGEGIYYQHIKAHNSKSELSWFDQEADHDSSLVKEVLSTKPVSLIHLPYDNELDFDEHETTARHIAALLNSGYTLQGRPIKPSDIGVLAKAKKDLKRVEDELVKINIPTLTTSDVSIFETAMAKDVAALLSAMLYPYRHDMINRVLTSHLYGLSIKQVQEMMSDHESGVSDHKSGADSNLNQINSNESKSNVPVGSAELSIDSPADNTRRSYQDFISYLKKGAQNWQDYGVLSAINYLFDKSPVQPNGVWQSLASLPDGDRYIMDLRHVTDVLAQYGVGMGEHELLTWFRQNIEAAPNNDWAKQYPLPTDSGVQLMTIHKSKGLEFPIVYVLGMGKASRQSGNREQYGLYLYNAQQKPSNQVQPNSEDQLNHPKQASGNQRRFSPVKGLGTNESFYTDIETQEDFDELKRLGYVAFTRASEQLYIVLQDPSNKGQINLKPVFYWFDSKEAKFELPNRLIDNIGMVRGTHINAYFEANLINGSTKGFKTGSNGFIGLTQQGNTPKPQPIEYQPFDKVMKVSFFYGWSKTSFTALARQLDESSQALAVVDERIDDATDIDISTMDSDSSTIVSDSTKTDLIVDAIKQADDIRFSFVRGANAGTFLHEIFEKIDFNNHQHWSGVIDRAVSGYQLPLIYASPEQQLRTLGFTKSNDQSEIDSERLKKLNIDTQGLQHQALKDWIEEVLQTPLLASGQRLIDIAPNKRFAEMGFNMGLSESFKPQAITEVFRHYLAEEPDKHVNLSSPSGKNLYRYLRGEIDLVYEHAGKFYVVDYKSNHLGNSLSNYSESNLKQAMSKAGYWLQAAIYQVALHRYLSLRIKDYIGNEDKYLGSVEYVFLRGTYNSDQSQTDKVDVLNTSGASNSGGERYGLVIWDIPIEFVKALDKLFGRPIS
ncbi:UvrD-helicase domain-containing protein [Psychrobacter sp.]|uniref:UvrD-helicase domain-containing protein n=1 Tax=Psychrobacter sp. TaxID=56811 RepID=UPI0025FD7C87|nr:UvrD-helicase domain-containing protein [Psychrobacter sp.]